MQLVRQPAGSSLCFACCIAMVTDTSLDEVLANCELEQIPEKHRNEFSDVIIGNYAAYSGQYLTTRAALHYLFSRGYMFGLIATLNNLVLTSEWSGRFEFDVSNLNAIVTVKSIKHENCNHAVVFNSDRQKIYDPQSDLLNDLSDYTVLEWAPIQRIPRF